MPEPKKISLERGEQIEVEVRYSNLMYHSVTLELDRYGRLKISVPTMNHIDNRISITPDTKRSFYLEQES